MYNRRYGDLRPVWRKTDGNCHLCHEPVDISTYGQVSLLGGDAATVDHIIPQSHGGIDHHSNLLPAHHRCNASRGNRAMVPARRRMAGVSHRPLSRGEKTACGVLTAGLSAGVLFSKPQPNGRRQFNKPAAVKAGLLAGLCLAIAYNL